MSPRRHRACYNDPGKQDSDIRSAPTKNVDKSNDSATLPPCSSTNNKVKRKKKISHHSTVNRQRSYNRDLEILYSMPSLSHPDFTEGQRRVLLSLARIYTNLTPIRRANNGYLQKEPSFRNQTAHSRDNHGKRHKPVVKNKSNPKPLRRDSLQTAVKEYTNENETENDMEDEERLCTDKDNKDYTETNSSGSEYDEMLDDMVQNIIHNQSVILTEELQKGDFPLNDNNVKTEQETLTEYRNQEKIEGENKYYSKNEVIVKDDEKTADNMIGETTESSEEMKEVDFLSQKESHETDVTIDDNASVEEKEKETISENEDVSKTCKDDEEVAKIEEDVNENDNNDKSVDTVAKIEITEIIADSDNASLTGEIGSQSENQGTTDVDDNVNLLRYISDELKQLMINS